MFRFHNVPDYNGDPKFAFLQQYSIGVDVEGKTIEQAFAALQINSQNYRRAMVDFNEFRFHAESRGDPRWAYDYVLNAATRNAELRDAEEKEKKAREAARNEALEKEGLARAIDWEEISALEWPFGSDGKNMPAQGGLPEPERQQQEFPVSPSFPPENVLRIWKHLNSVKLVDLELVMQHPEYQGRADPRLSFLSSDNNAADIIRENEAEIGGAIENLASIIRREHSSGAIAEGGNNFPQREAPAFFPQQASSPMSLEPRNTALYNRPAAVPPNISAASSQVSASSRENFLNLHQEGPMPVERPSFDDDPTSLSRVGSGDARRRRGPTRAVQPDFDYDSESSSSTTREPNNCERIIEEFDRKDKERQRKQKAARAAWKARIRSTNPTLTEGASRRGQMHIRQSSLVMEPIRYKEVRHSNQSNSLPETPSTTSPERGLGMPQQMSSQSPATEFGGPSLGQLNFQSIQTQSSQGFFDFGQQRRPSQLQLSPQQDNEHCLGRTHMPQPQTNMSYVPNSTMYQNPTPRRQTDPGLPSRENVVSESHTPLWPQRNNWGPAPHPVLLGNQNPSNPNQQFGDEDNDDEADLDGDVFGGN